MKSSKRSFFDITEDIVSVKQDLFANEEDIEDRLQPLLQELSQKEDGVYWFVKKIQQDIDLADEYIGKIQAEKKRRQNAIKSMKGMVIDANKTAGQLPKHSEFNPLKILESASVDIIDESKIPDHYWVEVMTKRLDKKRILNDLKKGTKVPGTDIKRTPYVKGLK